MSSNPLRHGSAARDVQGNVLSAFNKPRATFLLVALADDVDAARAWLAELEPLVATTEEVEDFYEERPKPGGETLSATWTGLGLTWPGLRALAPRCDLDRDLAEHWAFRVGPARRAEDLGDDTKLWLFGRDAEKDPDARVIHAVITVAADSDADLAARREEVLRIGERHGAETVCERACAVLPPPLRGREHFGFKDGISQPGVKQFHASDPRNPTERKGHRGQLLVEPGEFVLGWPREDGRPEAVAEWLRNGSFQVVRRLDQDVAAWREALDNAARNDARPDAAERWAARLIGRSRSGRPLVPHGTVKNNAFDYDDDPEGEVTPRFAHIRKVFPRGERDRYEPQRHRLMRRGIPFGDPYQDGKDDGERGMMFNAFMSSIERQFEHVQRLFANKPDFPQDRDGPDAVIGQRDPVADKARLYQNLPTRKGNPGPVPIQPFVRTRGAVYALAPSKAALRWLARGGTGRAGTG